MSLNLLPSISNKIRSVYQKAQNSAIGRFTSSALDATGLPKSFANIGAAGTTGIGALQMAFNKPEAAQKSFDTALKLRQYAGTTGSFDQGFKSGMTTLGRGGVEAAKVALTGKGLKYVTPTKLGVSGLLGGGISKVSGGDFASGAGAGVGSLPSILGFTGMTNPFLSKALQSSKVAPIVSGGVGSRIAPAIGNAIQGVGLDLSRGMKTTPMSVGVDLLTGAVAGKTQFDMPNVNSKGFAMDKGIKDKLVQAEDMLLNPRNYLEERSYSSLKLKKKIEKDQLKNIQNKAAEMIEQLSAKYLPNKVLDQVAGDSKKQIKALIDLNAENRLTNVQTMGITDQSKGVIPEVGGVKPSLIDKKVDLGFKTNSVLENPSTSQSTLKLPENQSKLKTNLLSPETKPESTLVNDSQPYFNTNKLKITKKNKKFVDSTIEEIKPEIEKVTGKKLKNKEVVKLTNQTSGLINKVITRDETLAWETKMLNARKLLAKQASDGKVTQEYLDNLLAIKSQGTDIARKLQSLSIGADPQEITAKQAILESILKLTDDTNEILKNAKSVDFNNFEEATNFYRQYIKPNASDWLEKVRYSSMLSSPNTHINNFSSNAQGTGIIAPLEKTISGGVDWLLSAINPKRQRQQFAGEGIQYSKGAISNLGNAWTKFKDTLSGKNMSTAQEMYNIPLTEKGTIGRKVENVLSIPSKLLQASDEFFTTLTKGGVESSLNYRQKKGLKISGIEDKAYLEARKRLFNSEFGLKEEGPVLKALEYLPQKVAEARNSSNPIVSTIAKYTFPFVRVPSNILKASVEYSPLGATTIPGASNKVEQLSKAILGSSIGLAVATLVSGDRMTWAEPTTETKRNEFRAAGLQPYSIKIGNNWYSYSKLHPAISFNLALVAAVRNAEKNKTLNDKQIDVVLDGLSSWVNFYADMSYVKNIGDAVSGIKGDLSAGTRQMSNYVQQLIPFRSLMGWVERIVDPVQRQADPDGSLLKKQLQQVMTQIPGLASMVPERQDSLGNPVENQNRIINAFSPVRVTTENSEHKRIYDLLEQKTINTRNTNAIKENIKKSGKTETYNEKIYYEKDGEVKTLDLGKVSSMPEQTAYQRALKEKEAYKLVDNVLDNLPEDQQIEALKALGITGEDATYYNVARQENALKSVYVEEEIMGMIKKGESKEYILNSLAKMRKEINGKILLADGVINDLVDKNIISYQDGKNLKNVGKDLKPKKLSTGKKPKKVNVTARRMSAMPKATYKPIALKVKKGIKFKPPKYVKVNFTTSKKLL